ncbi:MAG: 3-phosphoserine/phosphohydroxythreonine transaminase [Planctomycetota bacterium]|nr:3-phosphoserine/phosphohydroxythreonine transaminase [Planctomycetota bacterium]MEC8733416.1 3-phosphoserine/phosphohydroxythreonine transaminase [Planctomycetota bacterium]MEC8817476.1 3-phosphoserine/phosphohydroxythreonine transaminase [Planctomycetota bacterium]MED5507528.1 3-phosphoserine/phosphohydroxythreonine transaminase [Planctomycetota bacterium]
MSQTQSANDAVDTLSNTERTYNFSAGPAVLPEEVLRQAQRDLWDIDGTGIGVLEHSHRDATIDRVFEEAEKGCRELAGIGDDHAVLFLSGGACQQFAMLAMNFLTPGRTGDYLVTGNWARTARSYADSYGSTHAAYDGTDCVFDHVPAPEEISYSDDPVYVHYCSNNTIYGTSYAEPPRTEAPLIADMSSEMFSRPWDYSAHAMTYACAQKNLGPAGGSCVIISRELLERTNQGLPKIFRYEDHVAKGSRLNTPPVFTVYMMGLAFRWISEQGGVDQMASRNREKAGLIYDAIDGSDGFWIPHARKDSRSMMNINFRTSDPELDKRFIQEAHEHGMSALKGHRSVGGMRASVYNAFPRQGCVQLAEMMREFARTNG